MNKLIGVFKDHFGATPILITILILNGLLAAAFGYTMHSANVNANIQAELLEKCLLRR
jgi:hypothetical protein